MIWVSIAVLYEFLTTISLVLRHFIFQSSSYNQPVRICNKHCHESLRAAVTQIPVDLAKNAAPSFYRNDFDAH